MLPKTDFLLSFAWRAAEPHPVNEILNVYPNGELWYWSQVPAEGIERAGTFQTRLEPSQMQNIHELADALAASPANFQSAAYSSVAHSVSVIAHGKMLTYSLAQDAGTAIGRAFSLGKMLVAEAERSPLAVVRATLSEVAAARGAGQALPVQMFLENTGSQSVDVLLNTAQITLFERDTGMDRVHWHGTAQGNTIGITDTSGQLLGGLYGPATIAAGHTGVMFLNNVVQPRVGGTLQLIGQLDAYLDLYYPTFAQIEASPTVSCRVQTPTIVIVR